MNQFSRVMLAGVVAVVTVGCGRGAESTPEKPEAAAGTPEAAAEHANPAEVKVEASMLRDLRLTTTKVESRRGDEQVTLLGELTVDERAYAEVGSPVAARVMRVLVGPGEQVRDGQALLDLQSTEVGRARSTYATAVAQQALADATLARKRALAADRIAPLREVQEAEAAASAARAEVRAASAALTSLGLAVPDGANPDAAGSPAFTLAAPVAGTVIERRVVRGQTIEPATTVFRIANLAIVWLTVHAFERDAVRLRAGTAARVTFAALPGQDFAGTVTLVGHEVSSTSRTVDIRIEIRNRGGQLRPGMSASAALLIGVTETPILTVPVAAVQRVRDNWCVFVPKADGVFEIRKIGRGRDLGTEVEVLSGLQAGDVVVVDGAFVLKAQAEKGNADHHGGD